MRVKQTCPWCAKIYRGGNNYSTENLQSYFKGLSLLPTHNFYFHKSYVFNNALNNLDICHQTSLNFSFSSFMKNRVRSTGHVFTQQFCVSLVSNNFPMMSESFLMVFFLSHRSLNQISPLCS